MKKITLIAAICFLSIAASMQAQTLSSTQLKKARIAVCEWLDSYEKYSKLIGHYRADDFRALFMSDTMSIYNDCFFINGYDFTNPYVTVKDYVQYYFSQNPLMPFVKEISDIKIKEEILKPKEGICEYRVQFSKTVYSTEKDNSNANAFMIPPITIQLEVVIEYNVRDEIAQATSLKALNPQSEFIVFHQDTINQICTEEYLNTITLEAATPLVTSDITTPSINDKFRIVGGDTLKQNIHFSPYVGGAFYSYEMINPDYPDLHDVQMRPTLSEGFDFGYYHQYKLTDKHRVGMEINASYLYRTLEFSGVYNTRYSAVDQSDAQYRYERRIDLDNYNENISSHVLYLSYVPIRHDILCSKTRNYWSFYWSLGVFASYTVSESVHATANGKYSGYYKWLFDVVMDQRGIYDFGEHQIDAQSNKSALRKFNVGIVAALGFQFFIPKSQWAIEPSVRLQSSLYMPTEKEYNFHIIDEQGNWKSATYLFSKMYLQNIGFQLNFNYHFK